MSHILSISQPSQVPPKRYKTSLACTTCRRRKLKCDGQGPACSRCRDSGHRGNCTYIRSIDGRGTASSHEPEVIASSPRRIPVPVISPPATVKPIAAIEPGGANDDGVFTEFDCRVRAAIDNKFDLPTARKRYPIPMADAPLFGEGPSRSQDEAGDFIPGVDNVLPTRKHADYLLSLYWWHLEPIEPLFDRGRFSQSYQALFTGGMLDCDERVFCSTLNCILALSTQLQEWLPQGDRNKASNTFFQRAWSLLRPEAIVWGVGSVDIVQCLVLMVRYLQCTKNLHQTWMAVGLAVHIARSLGLHSPTAQTSSSTRDRYGWLGRQVWQCCVSLDRNLSCTLGQASMTSLTLSPFLTGLGYNEAGTESPGQYALKMAELNDLTNYIILSQAPLRGSVAESLGLPPLIRKSPDISAVVKIEERLNEFKDSLAPLWNTEGGGKDTEESPSSRQRVLFGVRLAHARILLFRPYLASFCLPQKPSIPVSRGLESRVLQSCATLCVESVQEMITMVCEDYKLGAGTATSLGKGVLPWWYRFFYLHLASQHLIAAMMRSDVFQHMVKDYWEQVISTLCAYEHLSPSITACISSFRTMWQKLVDIQGPLSTQLAPETFQDVFQDLGFEADADQLLSLGVGDTGWAGCMFNFDWNSNNFPDGAENFTNADMI